LRNQDDMKLSIQTAKVVFE